MAAASNAPIRVTPTVLLEVYYDRQTRAWWAFYTDNAGIQIGDAWFGPTRDDVLIFRPATPEN